MWLRVKLSNNVKQIIYPNNFQECKSEPGCISGQRMGAACWIAQRAWGWPGHGAAAAAAAGASPHHSTLAAPRRLRGLCVGVVVRAAVASLRFALRQESFACSLVSDNGRQALGSLTDAAHLRGLCHVTAYLLSLPLRLRYLDSCRSNKISHVRQVPSLWQASGCCFREGKRQGSPPPCPPWVCLQRMQ